jgi:hypothetical protein
MRWAGYAACMGEKRKTSRKEAILKNLDVDGG